MSVEVTRLPTGLLVVTDAMPHLETASLGVWVGSGSRDERPDEHGISHLLEHMAFKGTSRRTARQIAEEIEAVGGDLNAATSIETTAYYARVLRANVPLALDVLSDILADPSFDSEELRREQNVIVQEIGAAEDAPDDLIWDKLQETAFADQPIGRSILGTPATVRSFDRARLAAYLSRNYRSSDMSRASPALGRRRLTRHVSSEAHASRPAISNRLTSRSPCTDCRIATRTSIACKCSRMCSAAACPHACSRRCASSVASATLSMRSTRLIPTSECSASMLGPMPPMSLS